MVTLASKRDPIFLFSISCTIYTTKKKIVKTVDDWKGKDVEILSVVKKSGETIKFYKEQPGRIYKDSIIGTEKEEKELDLSDIKKITRNEEGKIVVIMTREGKTYQPISTMEKENKIIFACYKLNPPSEVDLILVRTVDTGSTLVVSILGISLVVSILFLAFGISIGPEVSFGS